MQVGQAIERHRPPQAPALKVRVDGDDVDLTGSVGVHLGPVEGRHPVSSPYGAQTLGVEPVDRSPRHEEVWGPISIFGVTGEGEIVDF